MIFAVIPLACEINLALRSVYAAHFVWDFSTQAQITRGAVLHHQKKAPIMRMGAFFAISFSVFCVFEIFFLLLSFVLLW
ncbi:MAG TPA: hypothetical protein EYP74_00410 [Anaerolineales bacterium]|nr:hypothetical protein [Anaerolineales bacterium]